MLYSDSASYASTLISIAFYLKDEGNYLPAIQNCEKALLIASRKNHNSLIGSACKVLSECHYDLRNYKKAFHFQERAVLMDNHLLNETRLKSIDELETKYRVERKEKELAIAKADSLLKTKKLERTRWLVIVLVLAITVIILSYVNARRKQQALTLIAAQEKLVMERNLEIAKREKQQASLKFFFIGQEKERKRVAQDLHDSLGGVLFALKLQFSKLKNIQGAEKVNELIKTGIEENRRISQNLLPPSLSKLGLVAAIREWVVQFEKNFVVSVETEFINFQQDIAEHLRLSVFRIVQELLTNAGKHAQARSVRLKLNNLKNGQLMVQVRDDGIGFDIEQAPPTLLKTVYSRVQLLNGQLDIQSDQGKGTTVSAKIDMKV